MVSLGNFLEYLCITDCDDFISNGVLELSTIQICQNYAAESPSIPTIPKFPGWIMNDIIKK